MTHHAYIAEGALALLPELAQNARARFGFTDAHNPDVHLREFEKFGIEESRWLIHAASLRPSAGRALYLIGVGSITSEAQQALLKLFEEPQAGVVFVLLVPHGVLLPTVRSRMQEYPKFQIANSKSQTSSKFLKSNQKERSNYIAEILKDDEGAKEKASELVDGLEVELYKKVQDPKARAGLENVAMVRGYLRDRSPSLKMLLEHLAISLPILS